MKASHNARLLTLEPEDMQEALLLWEATNRFQKDGVIHTEVQPEKDGQRRIIVAIDLAALRTGSCFGEGLK